MIVSQLLGFLTLVGGLATLAMAGVWAASRSAKRDSPGRALVRFFSRRALVLGLVVALVATLGSLYYSEVAGFPPCKLCWYQRILMYPQVLLFAVALGKRDRGVLDYSIVLSGVGAAIALYHYLMQRGVISEGECAVVGYSVSCSQQFFLQYGYITIPMMALTAFVMLVGLGVVGRGNFFKA